MDSQQWGNNITCYADDDCQVDCTTCRSRIITCRPGYSCIINCDECYATKIKAFDVSHLTINCTSCRSASIEATLFKPDALFQLNCYEPQIAVTYPGCPYLNAKISHIESIYESALLPNNDVDTITINCNGDEVCDQIYIDSTINGRFKAKCDGSSACYGNMIYNPPPNTGQMELTCISQDITEACYRFHIMSLTTRTIYVHCGDGTQKPSQSSCYSLSITGPVMPFDDSVTEYSMDKINKDSVIIDCSNDQCKRIKIYVPFGEFQTTALNYVYDWDNGVYIRWEECGWDFPAGGWDEPQRNVIQCSDEDSIKNLVLWFLAEGTGSNVVVTNNYMFDSRLSYNQYSCINGKHCIIYAMERNNRVTHIDCPNDGVSYCYILAMQPNGLTGAVIDGQKTRLMLIKGYDKGMDADGALTDAIIYGPDKTVVPNGILVLPAGNAYNSWIGSVIHAANTPMIFVFQTNSAFVGSVYYVNHTDWTHIDCSYHSMCQDMTVYVEHDSFSVNSIIPESLCISFGGYTAGCNGATLKIKDTNTQNVYTLKNQLINNTCYWVDTISSKTVLAPSSNGICAQRSREILNNTWYWWYDPLSALYADAPKCNWIKVYDQYTPPIANYCYVTDFLSGSFQQTCTDGEMEFKYYQTDPTCSGTFQLITDNGLPNDCNVGVECGYAAYVFKKYNMSKILVENQCLESAFIGWRRGGFFLDICINGGEYYECDDNTNTLKLYKYNDTVNCTGDPYAKITYNIGDCMEDFSVEEIQCNHITTTTTSSPTYQPTLPSEPPTNPPTTTDCRPALFNVTITIKASDNTALGTIIDIIYTETVKYLQDIGSTYLLSIFCRGSIFITFQQIEEGGDDEDELEVKLFITEDENSKLEVDKIDDDEYGDVLQDAIKEKTGQDMDVDIDLEINGEKATVINQHSSFLGLAEGVQYLLVGGLIFIIILLICAVTICCVFRCKNKNAHITPNPLKKGHESIPTNDGEVGDNTFPFMDKTTTDYDLGGVDLQKRNNKKGVNNPVIVQREMTELVNTSPALPLAQPGNEVLDNVQKDDTEEMYGNDQQGGITHLVQPIPPPIPAVPVRDEGVNNGTTTGGVSNDAYSDSEEQQLNDGHTSKYCD